MFFPSIRRRFLTYGLRTPPADPSAPSSPLSRLLDAFAALQVPHSFFTHFYVLSVASSLFWAWYWGLPARAGTVRLTWALMSLQGARRLAESVAYMSASKSTMWVGHWLLGLAYYAATGVAVWAESSVASTPPSTPTPRPVDVRALVLVPAILAAQGLQHVYHAYLYGLRKQNKGYQLPQHPLFPNIVCPHYSCEVAFYVLMAVLAAPEGKMVSTTWSCVVFFVAVNLGITADGTRRWYVERFGEAKVGRWRMVPGVW